MRTAYLLQSENRNSRQTREAAHIWSYLESNNRFRNLAESSDVDAALELYTKAKDHPMTTTIDAFRTRCNINIGQPMHTLSDARFFYANNKKTGINLVIKSQRHNSGEVPTEIQICKDLAGILVSPTLAFVPTSTDIVEIRSTKDEEAFGRRGSFCALIMPRFEGTLADPIQHYEDELVHANLLRIVDAVECLHLRGYVHMDIKGDNHVRLSHMTIYDRHTG